MCGGRKADKISGMKAYHAISIHGRGWDELPVGARLQVLSVHGRAVNLVSESGRIFSLVHPSLGNGPATATVEGPWPLPCVVSEHLMVDVKDAGRWEPPDPPPRVCIDPGPTVRAVAGFGSRAGILPAALTFLQHEMAARPAGLAGVMFDMALEGISTLARGDWAAGARRLAGLGPGLTPSGDDLLCGYLLTLHRAGETEGAEGLASAVLDLPDSATTPLSRHFLRWATRGVAGEHHLRFLDSLLTGGGPEHLAPLLAHGATSGADWAAGALLAVQGILIKHKGD